MTRQKQYDQDPMGADATLDAHAADSSPLPQRGPKVELVRGSRPALSGQTESLLRVRLRAAALVLFLGSAAFLAKSFASPPRPLADPALAADASVVDLLHVALVAVLGATSMLLWTRRERSIRTLRWAELIVFGATGAFFVVVQHFSTVLSAQQMRYVSNPVSYWYALMFTYAIFIPTSWRRAAVVLGAMAAAPILGIVFDMARYEQVAELTTFDHVIGLALMMLIGYGSCVYGTHMIGALRQEAFEARQLGQYRLRYLLGTGGMGQVYLAEHQLLKRPCAIKLIRPGKAHDPRALARFEREVRATARLSHWNTVEIFDYGSTDDGTFYYVMEYLPGLSLGDLVERYGPLPPERVIYLLQQTCDALREAHAMGLVHRDIKPGNIFAAYRGGVYDVAKLLDFGLAKLHAEEPSVHLTREGAITGSPLYMSPEQALGEQEPDARGDIYSLGAVAYFLLTGRPPFDGERAMRVLVAHAHDEVVPPSQLRSDVPADLEQVVLRCLAKQPTERYQDAASLAQALALCDASGEWTRELAARWWGEVGQPTTVAVG
jgi:eukaryotic-like serine/threonine-protein kinase